jgi:hypothetical protein
MEMILERFTKVVIAFRAYDGEGRKIILWGCSYSGGLEVSAQ